ncbi:MAG: NAD(P)/FAD-dependent oxidoreductase [Candidatus Falkowbacteria bacterium]|nr:NAD(P)/FAD-dependent oxidoreductase [Candidatus Falkowbacteria bacterium]
MIYDVAVIGGGASGLMAAGRAGEQGAKTILIEKNNSVGVKLLMTGGTRCNLTNYLENSKVLAANFGLAGRFLISALTRFGPREAVDFFESRGVKTKIENNNRVFPISDQAGEVLNALISYVKKSGVEIKTGAAVSDIIIDQGKISEIILVGGAKIKAANYIIATGGQSYPKTGSSGDAYKWLKKIGHNIIAPTPALVPIIVQEDFIKELEGLGREEAALSLFQDGEKIAVSRGDFLFTASGLSGPAALNLSRLIKFPIKKGLQLAIDFFPELDISSLDEKLREIFIGTNRTLKNSLAGIIPPRLIPVLEFLTGLDMDGKAHLVTKIERRKLGYLLKDFRLGVKGLAGYNQAMITAGGLDLKEIDPKTMRSKIISNLFVAGEVLDIAGPTGGFNLQASWSTGRIAGEAAAADRTK